MSTRRRTYLDYLLGGDMKLLCYVALDRDFKSNMTITFPESSTGALLLMDASISSVTAANGIYTIGGLNPTYTTLISSGKSYSWSELFYHAKLTFTITNGSFEIASNSNGGDPYNGNGHKFMIFEADVDDLMAEYEYL